MASPAARRRRSESACAPASTFRWRSIGLAVEGGLLDPMRGVDGQQRVVPAVRQVLGAGPEAEDVADDVVGQAGRRRVVGEGDGEGGLEAAGGGVQVDGVVDLPAGEQVDLVAGGVRRGDRQQVAVHLGEAAQDADALEEARVRRRRSWPPAGGPAPPPGRTPARGPEGPGGRRRRGGRRWSRRGSRGRRCGQARRAGGRTGRAGGTRRRSRARWARGARAR